jgi:Arc/MetJ family transcription regulator
MRKHTTIDLDVDLVHEAGRVLGTTRTTDTVHAALADVIRRQRRMALLKLRPAIDLTDLEAMRRHRFAEERAPYDPGGTPE